MKINIKKFDPSTLEKAYGILCGDVLPNDVQTKIHNGYTWCVIEANTSSTLHKHFEFEMFIIYKGSGKISSAGETVKVEPLDCIFLDEFQEHEIINTGAEDIVLLSIWGNTIKPESLRNPVSEKTIITSTPPTPNGDLHLGHLSGPYLAADVYKRILLLQKKQAVHHTGADTYQNYVLSRAWKEDTSPDAIADKYTKEIKRTLEIYDIEVDFFLEPKQVPNYQDYVKEVFKELYKTGYIIAKETDTTYSLEDGTYLFESLIHGKCPNCKRNCSGNLCEDCGIHNDCVDLEDAKPNINDGAINIRKTKRLFFLLRRSCRS